MSYWVAVSSALLLTALLLSRRTAWEQKHCYDATLIATLPFLPGAATLLTILIFLAQWLAPGTNAPFWGSGIALVAWVLLSALCLRITDARYAIPSSYGELCQRLAQLKSQFAVLCPEENHHSEVGKMACKEITTQVQKIEEDFQQRDLTWASARGYINAWCSLHRAEEALIEIAPRETVIAGALNDVLRLKGSKIDHADDLIARIRQVIDVMDPTAAKYLQGAAAAPLTFAITTAPTLETGYVGRAYSQKFAASGGTPPIQWSLSQGSKLPDPPDALHLSADGILTGIPTKATGGAVSFMVRAVDSANVTDTRNFSLTIMAVPEKPAEGATTATSPGASPGSTLRQEAQARAVLRDVRGAINEFRDVSWNVLVVARNRLLATMMFTGLIAFVLLSIAIISGAQREAITAASVYFLVGAMIGLLNLLRGASQNDAAVEDYGLSTARLITMPLFCGLAALSGVVVMAMLQVAVSSSTPLTQPSSAEPTIVAKALSGSGTTPDASKAPGATPQPSKAPAVTPKPAKAPAATPVPSKGSAVTQESPKTPAVTAESPKTPAVTAESPRAPAVTAESPKAPATTFARSLADIFDLSNNFYAILLAAVFGLTPGLLFDQLQQQSEKYKTALKSSEATQVKPPATV